MDVGVSSPFMCVMEKLSVSESCMRGAVLPPDHFCAMCSRSSPPSLLSPHLLPNPFKWLIFKNYQRTLQIFFHFPKLFSISCLHFLYQKYVFIEIACGLQRSILRPELTTKTFMFLSTRFILKQSGKPHVAPQIA